MASLASLTRSVPFPCPHEHSHGNKHTYRSIDRTARGRVPFTTSEVRRCVTILSKECRNWGNRLQVRAQTEQATHTGSSTSTEETYRLDGLLNRCMDFNVTANYGTRLQSHTCGADRFTLNTVEARKSLRFREIYDGDGMRIVVDAVAIGSEAEQVLVHLQLMPRAAFTHAGLSGAITGMRLHNLVQNIGQHHEMPLMCGFCRKGSDQGSDC